MADLGVEKVGVPGKIWRGGCLNAGGGVTRIKTLKAPGC